MDSDTPDSHINHEDAKAYWSSIDADVNGMLGGFPQISKIDLQGSRNFLAKLGIAGSGKRTTLRGKDGVSGNNGKLKRAVDCGAGIGRITEGLLLSIAETVDIVEPVAKFSENLQSKEGIGRIWNVGLEDWSFEGDDVNDGLKYDLIWNQWCLGHLTDDQLVNYLRRCSRALTKGGWIMVKENLSTDLEGDYFDGTDNSVTRKDEKFLEIFQKAGLKIRRHEVQKGFPKTILPVKMYALQPISG